MFSSLWVQQCCLCYSAPGKCPHVARPEVSFSRPNSFRQRTSVPPRGNGCSRRRFFDRGHKKIYSHKCVFQHEETLMTPSKMFSLYASIIHADRTHLEDVQAASGLSGEHVVPYVPSQGIQAGRPSLSAARRRVNIVP